MSASGLEHLCKCRLRFATTLRGESRRQQTGDPAMRLWTEVTAALRVAHERAAETDGPLRDGVDLTPPGALSTEESIVFGRVLEAYADAFGDESGVAFHPSASVSSSRSVAAAVGFELGTKVDLLFAPPGRAPILRRVHLRGRPGSVDATAVPPGDLAAAVALKLPAGRAHNDVVLSVDHLWTSGFASAHRVEIHQSDLDAFRTNVYEAVEAVLAQPIAQPGWWCIGCALVTDCDAIPSEASAEILQRFGVASPTHRAALPVAVTGDPDPTLGTPVQPAKGILVLSASRIRDFGECPRRFFLAHVLRVPVVESSQGDAAELGLAAHAELFARHADPALALHDATGIVSEHVPNDPWIAGRVLAHSAVCPRSEAEYLGGELDLRWLNRRKAVLVTGRVDALWRHRDGTLEVRDYKTGRGLSHVSSLDDDLGALVYLLLGAAVPGTRRVRVTYELLGEETARVVSIDASPTLIADAISLVEMTADRIRRERNFTATPSTSTCGRCSYRTLCPKAASSDEPVAWEGELEMDPTDQGLDW